MLMPRPLCPGSIFTRFVLPDDPIIYLTFPVRHSHLSSFPPSLCFPFLSFSISVCTCLRAFCVFGVCAFLVRITQNGGAPQGMARRQQQLSGTRYSLLSFLYPARLSCPLLSCALKSFLLSDLL